MRAVVAIALIALPLAACSTVKEAVRGPDLTPVGYPSALVPRDQEVLASSREPLFNVPAVVVATIAGVENGALIAQEAHL